MLFLKEVSILNSDLAITEYWHYIIKILKEGNAVLFYNNFHLTK
jgi:hypothetical protein